MFCNFCCRCHRGRILLPTWLHQSDTNLGGCSLFQKSFSPLPQHWTDLFRTAVITMVTASLSRSSVCTTGPKNKREMQSNSAGPDAGSGINRNLCPGCESKRKGQPCCMKNWKSWEENQGNTQKSRNTVRNTELKVHEIESYMLYITQDLGISGAEFRCEVWWISL